VWILPGTEVIADTSALQYLHPIHQLDLLARTCAKELGVSLTGTLGILLKAKPAKHIHTLAPLIEQLNILGFRLSPQA
jgi:predicted nucleic acid-binding protein